MPASQTLATAAAGAGRLLITAPSARSTLLRPFVALNYLLVPTVSSSSAPKPAAGPVDLVNATSTMPYTIDDSVKGVFAKGKQIVKLYKTGIVNVYKNFRESRVLLRQFSESAGSARRASNATSVTQAILDKAAADKISSDHALEPLLEKIKSQDAQSKSVVAALYPNLQVSLTRAQYQLIQRTPKDIVKLPLFSLIFAVFFEVTPVLVMLFPGIVPDTCILPGQYKKAAARRESQIQALKAQYATESSESEIQFGTSPYKLSKADLVSLVSALRITPRLVPVSLFSEKSLVRRLEAHIARVRADNYVLAWTQAPTQADQTLSGSGIWSLDSRELARACHERAIPTTTADEKSGATSKSEALLRLELFLWIVNFTESQADAGFFYKAPASLVDPDFNPSEFYAQQLALSKQL